MKTAEQWAQMWFSGKDSVQNIVKKAQIDALNHASQVVHDLSRGTRSDDRAAAIDEARDLILDESRALE